MENLGGYIDAALETWKPTSSGYKDTINTDNMALYLLQKIGYIDSDDKVHGMCASAMKQCQDYTFETSKNKKTYIPDNEVVRQYLNNTLAKIKVQQDAILADYAEDCRNDVQSCLTTNGYDEANNTSTASKTAINACAAEIKTCMSVSGYKPQSGTTLTLRAMSDWVAGISISCPVDSYLFDDGDTAIVCKACPQLPIITRDESSQYSTTNRKTQSRGTSAGGQTQTCECPEGYESWHGYAGVNGGSGFLEITDTSKFTTATLYCVEKITSGD